MPFRVSLGLASAKPGGNDGNVGFRMPGKRSWKLCLFYCIVNFGEHKLAEAYADLEFLGIKSLLKFCKLLKMNLSANQ